jgi:hypothetical protein
LATNKTDFLHLNDWVGTDLFRREELNENFRALDAKAKEHNDRLDGHDSSLGDITQLNTTDKSSVVNAIKEVKTQVNGKADQTVIGDLTQLNTTDKTSVVNAVNEIKTQANNNASSLADRASDTMGRGYNVKYPPAPLVAAKGDGVTDDSAAIQAIINQAAIDGAEVIFPKGTFVLANNLVLPSNTVLRGLGGTLKLVNNATTDPHLATLLWISGVSNIRILTLNFDGNVANQTPVDTEHDYRCMHIENSSNIVVSNCYFHDFKHQCIQIGTGSYTSNGVYNLLVDGNTFTNVWSALQNIESDSKYVFFTNNYVYNCQEHGITFYPGASYVTVSGNIFKNCGLRNGPYPNPDPETPPNGTYNYGSCIRLMETIYGTVSDNICENPRYGGIRVVTNTPTMSYQRAKYVTISNNIVMGGSRLGAQGHGIEVYGDNVVVNGNIVKDFTHISAATGIYLNGTNITVKGNQVQNANNGIIALGSYINMSDNILIDPGSFAITLGGASSLNNGVAIGNIIESQNTPVTRGVYLQANAYNCMVAANSYVNVQSKIVNNGVQTQFNNPVYYATSAPTTGTFDKGDRVINTNPFIGNPKGWICVTAGTFGTLSGVTGSITSGTATLTVNTTTGLAFGNYITIAGVTGTKRIIGISGNNITLDSNADATVTNAAVAYGAPLLQSEGNL